MKPTSQDFYLLFCNSKVRRVAETIQDGFSGMFVVLRILAEADKELSAGDISHTLSVTTARTAVILLTLKKKGYIVKSKSSLDARKTSVKITQKGIDALSQRKERVFESIDKFLSKLDDSEITEFFQITQKLLTT